MFSACTAQATVTSVLLGVSLSSMEHFFLTTSIWDNVCIHSFL